MTEPVAGVLGEMVGFCQALRRAGLSAVRTDLFVAALDQLEPMRRDDVYWAGRATLCASPDDVEVYDRLFADWFSGVNVGRVPASTTVTLASGARDDGDDGPQGPDEVEDLAMLASRAEVLRHRDVADLSPAEARHLAALYARLRVRLPWREVRRREPHHRGEVDVAATLRARLRLAGEPGPLQHRRRRRKPRRMAVLVDVSRSMAPYADQMLRLAHRLVGAAPGRVEVFTMGTRLTRVTRALRVGDAERALVAAGEVIPDWSGCTRLGEALEAFVYRWGRRGVARGAVVVVVSDGWERGDPSLLAQQAAQLQRVAHRVVWVNPHRGKPGFAPVQSGMNAVLPYVDQLVAGHTFATFEELMEVVERV